MKLFHVYILKCKDQSYYTGLSNDLNRRLEEHQLKKSSPSFTARKAPCKLVWSEAFQTIELAIAKEKQIKGWSRRKKEALIDGNWDQLQKLSRNHQKDPSTGSG